MNDTTYNDYILIKANPVISDYDDDRKITHRCNSRQYYPRTKSSENTVESNNYSELSSNRQLVTSRHLLNSQRPKSFDKIEIVPAVVYGPLPFS